MLGPIKLLKFINGSKVIFQRLSGIVGFGIVSPKHSFVGWLVSLDKIRTKVRLLKADICDDDICILCGQMAESTQQLF